MDTSNSSNSSSNATNNPILNVKVTDLFCSEHQDEQNLVKEYKKALDVIIKKIRPVLGYVCKPQDFVDGKRCVQVIDTIYMDENGNLFRRGFQPLDDKEVWMDISFVDMIEALQRILKQSELKREAHLDAIRQRREFLDGIMKLANSTMS